MTVMGAASAETLKVGPGQKYAKPSEAIRAAKDEPTKPWAQVKKALGL